MVLKLLQSYCEIWCICRQLSVISVIAMQLQLQFKTLIECGFRVVWGPIMTGIPISCDSGWKIKEIVLIKVKDYKINILVEINSNHP